MRSSMRGKWECKSDALWTYRRAGAAWPYGYVVQDKDTGRSDTAWDATVTATRLDDDTTIVEHASFEETRAALAQHAAQHADHGRRADA
jgi:hypothetical protein